MSLTHRPSQWWERIAILGCCLFVIGLIRLTLWKENQFFWLNIGGYPIWLRESVRFAYYPYLLFTAMSLCIVTRSVIGRFIRQLMYCRAWVLLLAAWILFFSNCGLLVANNVKNIWADKPLHHHEPIELEPGAPIK
ncbi:hypothetical protein ACWPKO_14535 [Coraliomargarita sp. W4R53]